MMYARRRGRLLRGPGRLRRLIHVGDHQVVVDGLVLFIFLAFVTANGGDFIKPLLLIPVAL